MDTTAPIKIVTDSSGCLILGVASQLSNVVPADFQTYVSELHRVECKTLLLLGPPPYPEVVGFSPIVAYHDIELDLVYPANGWSMKLFAIHDPALASSMARHRRAAALTSPYRNGPDSTSLVLVGGTRAGGDAHTQTIERVGGAWVVQVGVFSPCDPSDEGRDRSCGASILDIDLTDRADPVRLLRFIDFGSVA